MPVKGHTLLLFKFIKPLVKCAAFFYLTHLCSLPGKPVSYSYIHLGAGPQEPCCHTAGHDLQPCTDALIQLHILCNWILYKYKLSTNDYFKMYEVSALVNTQHLLWFKKLVLCCVYILFVCSMCSVYSIVYSVLDACI